MQNSLFSEILNIDDYCYCDWLPFCPCSGNELWKSIQNYCDCQEKEMESTEAECRERKESVHFEKKYPNKKGGDELRPVWPRVRKINLPNLDENLKKFLSGTADDFIFQARRKTTRGLHNGFSNRRSKYVGVSKNKFHFQALITHKKIKRYIGTFCTEKEAAIAYDFYALGLHGYKASTNFKYTGSQIKGMIEFYYSNNKWIDPSRFADSICGEL